MAIDLNFKTLTSTPTGVGGSTGKQTEVAFNENFEKVKGNFQNIYEIISSSVISEDLTMLKIDKTSSPWIVYYTADPVDTPEQSITWYPINKSTFASLLGSPYDNAALTTALNDKASAATVSTMNTTLQGAVQDIANNTTAIGVNTNNITSIQNELLSVVHTVVGDTLYMKYDSVQNLVYISVDGTTWIDINGMGVDWASITGNVTDNQALVNYVADEIAALASTLASTYATISDLQTHTTNTSNPHNVTKAQVGLGNCDNTSDLNKPISIATQAAIDAIVTSSPPVINITAEDYQTEQPDTHYVYFTSSHFAVEEPEPEEPEEEPGL